MKKPLLYGLASILLTQLPLTAQVPTYSPYETYDNRTVSNISIKLETLGPADHFDQSSVLTRLSTKVGDPFSQEAFDQDLKLLSEEYDRVDPCIDVRHGEINITIKLWEKPSIQSINWYGNDCIRTRTLQRKLGIAPNCPFNREEFNKAFNSLKELYVRKGFFEAELQYTVLPHPDRNEVEINIVICEGRSGRVGGLEFVGFTKDEEKAILNMVATKKYNLFTSWLTGTGTYKEDALDHDRLMIVNYLQNEGYADASIDISITESEKNNRIIITVTADKGDIYSFGDISFSGNTLFTDEEIEKVMLIKEGDNYSPELNRETMQAIQNLYGSKGYIEANVNYRLRLSPFSPTYDVYFDIEEGEQYYVGLVRVLGNVSTNTNVILRESLLYPGEVFNSRKLQATQTRLESVGFFKCVNVYAVRASDDKALGPNYRDVYIEVEETTTGSVSLFVGASTADSVFGGLDLTENNFNWRGLGSVWRDGAAAVRGNGEYFHIRASFGAKESNYILSWLDPYFNDSLWRVGFDVNFQRSQLQSNDYDIDTIGFSIYANYPLTNYWLVGTKYRFRYADIEIAKGVGKEAQKQEKNSGITTGVGLNMGFDSTDNPFKPHRGLRSSAEAEILFEDNGAKGKDTFFFSKFNYLNTYYYPVWRLGTLKFRGEARFIHMLGGVSNEKLPLSEVFFLGGDTTVRGYKPFIIGDHFQKKEADGKIKVTNDPQGGVSSFLVSTEYNQQIVPVLDTFVFWDGGAISRDEFDIGKFVMSYGGGIRLQVGGRVPLTIGVGFPINPEREDDKRIFFFSMGGQF